MHMRRLGSSSPWVSEIGLGCVGMSEYYGPADGAESVATIHAALDRGVTLLDTGGFDGMAGNGLLVRRALTGQARDGVQISVKFGAQRDPLRRVRRVRREPGGRQDGAGQHAAPTRDRLRGYLPPCAPGSAAGEGS